MGRVQPLISQLLHAVVDQAEQPLSPLPAGVGCPTLWKLTVQFVLCIHVHIHNIYSLIRIQDHVYPPMILSG